MLQVLYDKLFALEVFMMIEQQKHYDNISKYNMGFMMIYTTWRPWSYNWWIAEMVAPLLYLSWWTDFHKGTDMEMDTICEEIYRVILG